VRFAPDVAHPEIAGARGEFATCPDWVAAMDTGRQFAWITFKTKGDPGFDHRTNRAAKVRNVSRLRSQAFRR
jgi:hypothetical protein